MRPRLLLLNMEEVMLLDILLGEVEGVWFLHVLPPFRQALKQVETVPEISTMLCIIL
jgi:hypothetical protein